MAEGEAICFTAGTKGAAFGAGVIHAWLATNRPPPLVVAGISAGAFTAAAMQRCYRELAASKHAEEGRWKWFRRYLHKVSTDPLDFLWRAIPDPVDFSADKPPVVDYSCPELEQEEAEARRHYHLLTKLGVWLAGLPVRVNSVASLVVHGVRLKERYGVRIWELALKWLAMARVSAGIFWHILRKPAFFSERAFAARLGEQAAHAGRWVRLLQKVPRPLFGRLTWVSSVVIAGSALNLVLLMLAALLGGFSAVEGFYLSWMGVRLLAVSTVVTGSVLLALGLTLPFEQSRGRFLLALTKYLFQQLDISIALLHPYQLRRRLLELFREDRSKDGQPAKLPITPDPMPILLVSARLQDGMQVYAEPGDDLIEALLASLAAPGIFPPIPTDAGDLIDGVGIRQNPLPALSRWLREEHDDIARKLERDVHEHSVHVVYNVPIQPYDPNPGEAERPIDIVESAFVSQELARRRDTRQEVQQVNFMERVQLCVNGARNSDRLSISADEIAPPRDISFKNHWDPTREEILAAAAVGCKATLERLCAREIAKLACGTDSVPCASLIRLQAPGRAPFVTPGAPGVHEVCENCPRVLEYKARRREGTPPAGVIRSFGQPGDGTQVDFGEFAHLRDERPRLVFVASGGVFRGAFHIGTIAALHASELQPDLVVGASVGALMGGALAAISFLPREQGTGLLHDLTGVFLHVDSKVALTRTLKNAAKQLGVRARQIDLSPSEVRRMVRQGSRSDAGYATTGAPPALIDAISSLFLIPHQNTVSIASQFVAGHFAEAVNSFLSEVRKETLPSLDVQYSLMGVSLLEEVARSLFGEHGGVRLDQVQPYHPKLSFFATTSYLNRRMSLLLGRDFLTEDPAYDFVFAGLSSSAFPSVFAPRTEAEVAPGRGRTDVFFSDGGMFDNLPFLPAIEILMAVQSSERSARLNPAEAPPDDMIESVLDALQRRINGPAVIIAAGLDADPDPDPGDLDTLVKIYQRAGALKANGKIQSFADAAWRIHKWLEELMRNRDGLKRWLRGQPTAEQQVETLQFLDGIVDASILKIVPADASHINDTFAFCRATGLDEDKIRTSIADGCFQTLYRISQECGRPEFVALRTKGPPGDVAYMPGGWKKECAWFARGDRRLTCPFAESASAEIAAVQSDCRCDPKHSRE